MDRHTETADRIAITRRSCATGEQKGHRVTRDAVAFAHSPGTCQHCQREGEGSILSKGQ
ncbi:MAG: hypothetical protein SPM02_00435 [Bacteroidales bacterium]|nr:hypothetical protein [Bacteroidales bacterium]